MVLGGVAAGWKGGGGDQGLPAAGGTLRMSAEVARHAPPACMTALGPRARHAAKSYLVLTLRPSCSHAPHLQIMLGELGQGREWSRVVAVPTNLAQHMRYEQRLHKSRSSPAMRQHVQAILHNNLAMLASEVQGACSGTATSAAEQPAPMSRTAVAAAGLVARLERSQREKGVLPSAALLASAGVARAPPMVSHRAQLGGTAAQPQLAPQGALQDTQEHKGRADRAAAGGPQGEAGGPSMSLWGVEEGEEEGASTIHTRSSLGHASGLGDRQHSLGLGHSGRLPMDLHSGPPSTKKTRRGSKSTATSELGASGSRLHSYLSDGEPMEAPLHGAEGRLHPGLNVPDHAAAGQGGEGRGPSKTFGVVGTANGGSLLATEGSTQEDGLATLRDAGGKPVVGGIAHAHLEPHHPARPTYAPAAAAAGAGGGAPDAAAAQGAGVAGQGSTLAWRGSAAAVSASASAAAAVLPHQHQPQQQDAGNGPADEANIQVTSAPAGQALQLPYGAPELLDARSSASDRRSR